MDAFSVFGKKKDGIVFPSWAKNCASRCNQVQHGSLYYMRRAGVYPHLLVKYRSVELCGLRSVLLIKIKKETLIIAK